MASNHPGILNIRQHSLLRGNLLVLGSFVVAVLLSDFPHNHATPLLIVPAIAALAGTGGDGALHAQTLGLLPCGGHSMYLHGFDGDYYDPVFSDLSVRAFPDSGPLAGALGYTLRSSQAQLIFPFQENFMLKGFRDFILRGNVVDLAVAVIIGAAFSAITTSMTTNVITPLISALVGAPNFDSLVVHVPVLHQVVVPAVKPPGYVPPGEIQIGKFLNAAINFLIQAAVIYFLIVLPMQKLLARINRPVPTAPTTKICPECLSEIPIEATRCKFCTVVLPQAA